MSLIINHISDVRTKISKWKQQGLKIGLVPTMGALHIGHESLIKKARETCDKVIVSIFVNPTQFGPTEDFDKYPRTLESDSKICEANNVDMIFAPSANEMYPDGEYEKSPNCTNLRLLSNRPQKCESSFSLDKRVELFETGHLVENLTSIIPPEYFQNKLCGKSREGHFNGVALVVTKLFNITQADVAFFGLKDAQQFFIIKKLVKDLNIPIELVECPIIRDIDGLAMSSRNVYLTLEDRQKALCLNKMLNKIQELFKNGEKSVKNTEKEALKMLEKGVNIEYFEFVSTETLEIISDLKAGILIAIAVKLNNVRLIDNIILEN